MADDKNTPSFDEPDDTPADALEETVNAAEPAQVRKQTRQKAKRDQSTAEFWSAILSTEQGRRELWGLLSEAGLFEFRAGYGPNGFPDDKVAWFYLGQKGLAERWYLRWMAMDREGVIQMLAENEPSLLATISSAKKTRPRKKDDAS